MFLSLIILVLMTCGGAAVTYLFTDDEPLLWRLSAGNIIGSALFGLVVFLLACLFGLNLIVIFLAALVSLAPLILLRKKEIRRKFNYDKQKAKSQLQGSSFKKFYRFLYYAALFIMLWLFFDRAMITNDGGIFTGGSQNLGDLPFHLGAVFSFTEGANFPPQNPSFAGAKFTYPFIADLIAACFARVGAEVQNAFFIQNLTLGFSLTVLLEKFVCRLTGSKLAGRLAPLLLFFSGGIGFLWCVKDYWYGTKDLFEFIGNLPWDYTIGQKFRWGNSLLVLFMTQRSLLLGMPLTLIVLTHLWKVFSAKDDQTQNPKSQIPNATVGLLAGTLPLIHAHSLFVLFVVAAFLFFFRLDRWREWIAFGVGTAAVAIPALLWIMTGSASHLSEFIDWHFGWDLRDDNFFWFWFKNTGLLIPLLVAGIILWVNRGGAETDEKQKKKDKRKKAKNSDPRSEIPDPRSEMLLFYLPFAFMFVLSNSVKLAPWEWDNIKVLIYWFVGSIPFVAWLIAVLWTKNRWFKTLSAGLLLILIASGALDVWRAISGAVNNKVFDREAVEIAEQIRLRTPPDALFLNAPTYNTAVVLSGRRSLMRYPGHLSSHGIDYREREEDLKRIYAGEATAGIFIKKYGIQYVLISPEARSATEVNDTFFSRFPLIAEAGQYRVYKVGGQ
ncbi:MAG: hypothetical protein R2747_22295 [Pyrinomonadaceae bacterium]